MSVCKIRLLKPLIQVKQRLLLGFGLTHDERVSKAQMFCE